MAYFQKTFTDFNFYTGEQSVGDRGFVAFIIPGNNITESSIELPDALSNTIYAGIFVFSAIIPVITLDNVKSFIDAVLSITKNARAFLWLNDPANITETNYTIMSIAADGSSTVATTIIPLATAGLSVNIQSGMPISLKGTSLIFDGSNTGTSLLLSGPDALVATPATFVRLNFSGTDKGSVVFKTYILISSLYAYLQWGFQFLYPNNDNGQFNEFLPIATPTPSGISIGFNVCVDPSDVYNTAFDPCGTTGSCSIIAAYASRRTYFNLLGTNLDGTNTLLNANYTSSFGAAINLVPVITGSDNVLPSRFVLTKANINTTQTTDFLFSPEGDFIIQTTSSAAADNYLMCGLQATEFFQVTFQNNSVTGDTIRFISGYPAFAAGYPFQPASPVGPPQNPEASLLDKTFTTSWAMLLPTSTNAIKYISQPKGSALFGNDHLIAGNYTSLFGHTIPGFSFEPDDKTPFPLLPYSGTLNNIGFTQQQTEDYERLIISPTRRKQVGLLSTAKSLIHASVKLEADTDVQQIVTTPSGLLAQITTSGNQTQWNYVLLGQNTTASNDCLKFINPNAKLVEALQTSDLFLVVANAGNIINGDASFSNLVTIDGWGLQVNAGQNPGYADYKNIIIIKGKKGKLFDPSNPANGLVANPAKWTQSVDFSAPSTPGADGKLVVDPSQMINLSQWLQTYFQHAASESADPAAKSYFEKFNNIAQLDDWTGVLFLRLDIQSIPGNLSGIVAGVTDMGAFNAHHFAVDISPVKKNGTDAALEHPSTMFGLIYYVDPSFIDKTPYVTLAPTTTAAYDFRLLTLKVLFENTAVKSFESCAQLTLSNLFGSSIAKMGDPTNVYDNVLLKGSFQMNGNIPMYSLSSVGDNLFYPNSNIIHKIEITNAALLTKASTDSTKAVSWFSLSGFIDYYALSYPASLPPPPAPAPEPTAPPIPYDLFSFGNEGDADLTGQGLSFNNLDIQMTYLIADPSQKVFDFDVSQIAFDLSRSTPRELSIFTGFALDEVVLLSGTGDGTPGTLGYLGVIPDMRLSGVSNSPWYGLKFLLNLGTPGELAGKVGLNAYLLLAWLPTSTGTSYQAAVFISLPGTSGGASLISLQNVLKLSIGQIRLSFDTTSNAFLLMLTEIALKFLGLLKIPPSGTTLFYLFGNPKSGGKASGLGWYAMYSKDKQKAMTRTETTLL